MATVITEYNSEAPAKPVQVNLTTFQQPEELDTDATTSTKLICKNKQNYLLTAELTNDSDMYIHYIQTHANT